MNQTKITVKIYEPLLRDLDKQLDALFIKRDAFLNHMIQLETDYLANEMAGKRLSTRARKYISGELKRLGTHTVNVVVDKTTAEKLNAIVDEANLVRDAFVNRLIMFLRSSDSLLSYLDLPKYIVHSEFDSSYEEMPTSPLKAIESVFSDPLYYLRIAIDERYQTGLYLLDLTHPKFVGFSCYLGEDQIPGTEEYLQAQKESEESLNMALESFEQAFLNTPMSPKATV